MAYHHGNLREALITQGLRALAESGVDGISLRDIARRAGVSAPAVYRHFADKHALVAAIAIDCVERIRAAVDAALAAAPADDMLERFRATGVAYVRFAVAHPEHFRALSMPGIHAHLPDELRRTWGEREAAERASLLAGQAAGKIAPLPIDTLLLVARCAAHGLAHILIQGELGPVDDARATELADALTIALGVGLYPRLPADPLAHDPLASEPARRARSHTRPAPPAGREGPSSPGRTPPRARAATPRRRGPARRS